MRVSAHSQMEPAADAAAAAIMIRHRPRGLLGGFLLAIAGIWLAVALRSLHAGALEALPGAGAAGAVGAMAIGMALALIGVEWIARCRIVELDQGRLRATERRLTGDRVFEESLARYHGLRLRREQLPHRYGRRSWYVVEAWHGEPAKTVELARSKDPRRVEQWAEDWARRLALPLCQEPDEHDARAQRPTLDVRAAEAAASDRPLPAAYSAPLRR
jgi:hypothetical protein